MAKSLELLIQAKNLTEPAFKAIESQLKNTQESTAKAAKAAEGMESGFSKAGSAIKAFGAALAASGIVYAMDRVLKAQAAQEDAVNKLNLALANQGRYASDVSKSLVDYASSLQKVSVFGDEVILAAEATLASFGMNEEQIKRTTKAALDFAAATGTDLQTSVELLGKAFVGETGTLKRYGIVLDESLGITQKFDAAIEQIEGRFSGSALAATQTYTGQMEVLKNAFGDVEEGAGKLLGSMLDLGGGTQSAVQVFEFLSKLLGHDMVLGLGFVRAGLLEMAGTAIGSFADVFQTITGYATKYPRVAALLGLAPATAQSAAKESQFLKDFADGLKQQARDVLIEAEKAAESVGKTMTVVNAATEQNIRLELERAAAAKAAEKAAKAVGNAWEAAGPPLEKIKAGAVGIGMGFAAAAQNTGTLVTKLLDFSKPLLDAEKKTQKVGEKIAFTETKTIDWHQALADVANQFQSMEGFVPKLLGTVAGGIASIGAGLDSWGKAGGGIGGLFAKISSGLGIVGAGLGIIKGLGGLFGGLFGDKEIMEVNDLRDAFFDTYGGFEKFSQKMAQVSSEDWAKKIFDATTVEEFNRLVGEAQGLLGLQTRAQEELQAAVEKYGFTIEELGPKYQQQELDKMAGQLLKEWELLNASGIEQVTILEKMGPAFLEYVNTAIASGAALPEQMRPIIDSLYAQGQLVHENGEAFTEAEYKGISFTQSLTESMQSVIEEIRNLVSALTGIPNISRTVTTVHQNVYQEQGGEPPAFGRGGVVLPFRPRNAAAGIVTAPSPGGTLVRMGEAGKAELAAPVEDMLRVMTDQAMRSAGAQPTVVQLVLDGRVIDERVVKANQSGRVPVQAGMIRSR